MKTYLLTSLQTTHSLYKRGMIGNQELQQFLCRPLRSLYLVPRMLAVRYHRKLRRENFASSKKRSLNATVQFHKMDADWTPKQRSVVTDHRPCACSSSSYHLCATLMLSTRPIVMSVFHPQNYLHLEIKSRQFPNSLLFSNFHDKLDSEENRCVTGVRRRSCCYFFPTHV